MPAQLESHVMDLLWTCQCCGKQYHTLLYAYALDEPDPWRSVPEAERKQRGLLTSDLCTIDGMEFYLRGRIIIPVTGTRDVFIWGVWVSISKKSFDRIQELWDVKIRENEPPFYGWLSNDIPIYPKTFYLKCSIQLKNDGRRPSFELESTDHPLAIEQRNGITVERIKDIASKVSRHS